jgi:hypothetical protein
MMMINYLHTFIIKSECHGVHALLVTQRHADFFICDFLSMYIFPSGKSPSTEISTHFWGTFPGLFQRTFFCIFRVSPPRHHGMTQPAQQQHRGGEEDAWQLRAHGGWMVE